MSSLVRAVADLSSSQQGLLLRHQLVFAGSDALLRRLVRDGAITRVLQGVYADTAALGDPLLRERAALVLAAPGSALSHGSAAALHAPSLDCPSVPEVIVPTGRPLRVAGVRAHQAVLSEDDVRVVAGLRVTSPERSVLDLCRSPGRRVAQIASLDAVLHATGVEPAVVERRLRRMAGQRGVTRGRLLLADAEPGAASPGETRLRLVVVDAGLPRPRAQVPSHDDAGGWLATHDLGWDEILLFLEYEGDVHLRGTSPSRDRRRFNLLELRAGSRVVLRYGAAEVARPRLVVGDVTEVMRVRCPAMLQGLIA